MLFFQYRFHFFCVFLKITDPKNDFYVKQVPEIQRQSKISTSNDIDIKNKKINIYNI